MAQTFIDNRYLALDRLGRGGMGEVYKVQDRLSSEVVALKRVTTPADQLTFASRAVSDDLRIALAHEFRTLASLRHPNIISVLDYGFEAAGQPYFTMDYLAGGADLLEAAQSLSLTARVDFLLQTLQALAYLHRRQVLHRDLKPGNVLVMDGQVRVLDFGLAMARDKADGMVGTLAYIAPELLIGDPPTEATDLYAVGVMAYQMFAGRHPFKVDDAVQLVQDILLSEPDISILTDYSRTQLAPDLSPEETERLLTATSELDLADVGAQLAPVVQRLLHKRPAERYQSAQEVMAALIAATGQSVPQETVAIRESFLQAAQFVGREAEIGQLEAALSRAVAASGSAWLIGGESGVGKTRLADELRTRALVTGARVLRGQGVNGGGLPYQLWREPLRRLALMTDVTNVEAGVLKPIVPDIADLLGRDVPDVPALAGQAERQRLVLIIAGLFRRLQQPVVLILEDLQWASESLLPLAHLSKIVDGLPLLIVGNYRDDERPDLPEQLPHMQPLKLQRLSTETVAALSASMLGEAGRRPQVVDLLQRETEGNVYFLVETVRALAEEAGGLSDIAGMTLPQRVLAGGVMQIVRRRLDQVSGQAREWLKLAAVAGRYLDLRVLQAALGQDDLTGWLATCADVAVLDVQEDRWLFAHDKLREVLRADLSDDERPALHRRVAEALEAVYPGDEARSSVLAEHWRIAGDPAKELAYASPAIMQALAVADVERAVRLAERALDLLALDAQAAADRPGERAKLLRLLAQGYEARAEYDAAISHLEEALALTRALGDDDGSAGTLIVLGRIAEHRSQYPAAHEHYEAALALAEAGDFDRRRASALSGLGSVALRQRHLDTARAYFEQSLGIMRDLDDRAGTGIALGNLGTVARAQRDDEVALAALQESLAIAREIGDRKGVGVALNNLGLIAHARRELPAARQYFEESLAVKREVGEPLSLGLTLTNLGLVADDQDDYEAADAYLEESVVLMREVGNKWGVAASLCNLAFVELQLADAEEAQQHLREALRIAQELGSEPLVLELLVGCAWLYLLQGDPARGVRLAAFIEHHPKADDFVREARLAPVQQKFNHSLPSSLRDVIARQAAELDLETAVAACLGEANG